MKKSIHKALVLFAVLSLCLASSAIAQTTQTVKSGKASSVMIYRGGPVMQGASNVYLIFYGDWPTDNTGSSLLIQEFIVGLGSSPYFRINTMYPDSLGNAPSGALFYGGSVFDRTYKYGIELTTTDIGNIVFDQLEAGFLPVDAFGVYLVLGTPDVGSDKTGSCSASTPPHHGWVSTFGNQTKYAFIGNPLRCPMETAPQFFSTDGGLLPTPNDNFEADAMVSRIAHALNAIITNPTGTAWQDRLGLDNGDKCMNMFGETYHTENGAQANMQLYGRHFLIQQNWVNTLNGYCALSSEGLGSDGKRGAQ
jgi:hypothetical protein